MWNTIKCLKSGLLQCSDILTYSKRSTFILKRIREPRLNPLGREQKKTLKRREYYYELIKNKMAEKSPTTELVLLRDVPGIGMGGDKIELNRYIGYRDLILPKLAVYATSEEALAGISETKESSSVFSKIVGNFLSTTSVPVFLSLETKWTLEPWHVKTALRKTGLIVHENCITLPSEKILGPNPEIENRDFLVQVTMNKAEKFNVRCRIFHWSQKDRTLNQKTIDMCSESEPLFPEQRETINTLIENEKEFKISKKAKAQTVQAQSKKKKVC